MSKSKKNTIDPQNIIKIMGLMLQDCLFCQIAHQKDVQWSEEGYVIKFLQKL